MKDHILTLVEQYGEQVGAAETCNAHRLYDEAAKKRRESEETYEKIKEALE